MENSPLTKLYILSCIYVYVFRLRLYSIVCLLCAQSCFCVFLLNTACVLLFFQTWFHLQQPLVCVRTRVCMRVCVHFIVTLISWPALGTQPDRNILSLSEDSSLSLVCCLWWKCVTDLKCSCLMWSDVNWGGDLGANTSSHAHTHTR